MGKKTVVIQWLLESFLPIGLIVSCLTIKCTTGMYHSFVDLFFEVEKIVAI